MPVYWMNHLNSECANKPNHIWECFERVDVIKLNCFLIQFRHFILSPCSFVFLFLLIRSFVFFYQFLISPWWKCLVRETESLTRFYFYREHVKNRLNKNHVWTAVLCWCDAEFSIKDFVHFDETNWIWFHFILRIKLTSCA